MSGCRPAQRTSSCLGEFVVRGRPSTTRGAPRIVVSRSTVPSEVSRIAGVVGGSTGTMALLVLNPASRSDEDVVAVAMSQRWIGWLSAYFSRSHVAVLALLHQVRRVVSVPDHRSWEQGQHGWVEVSVDLREGRLLISANTEPEGPVLQLPLGGPVRLRDVVSSLPGYSQGSLTIWLHVTLLRVSRLRVECGSDEVEIAGGSVPLGFLPEGHTAGHLELLDIAEERGLALCSRAAVHFGGGANEIELWAPAVEEVADAFRARLGSWPVLEGVSSPELDSAPIPNRQRSGDRHRRPNQRRPRQGSSGGLPLGRRAAALAHGRAR